jgi:hypothetical protein
MMLGLGARWVLARHGLVAPDGRFGVRPEEPAPDGTGGFLGTAEDGISEPLNPRFFGTGEYRVALVTLLWTIAHRVHGFSGHRVAPEA